MSDIERAMFIVYISGVITSIGDMVENIKAFARKEKELNSYGFTTYNPAVLSMDGWNQQDYMTYYVNCVLPACSAIYMMKGWENSKGACIEHEYALAHGMTVIYE